MIVSSVLCMMQAIKTHTDISALSLKQEWPNFFPQEQIFLQHFYKGAKKDEDWYISHQSKKRDVTYQKCNND